MNTTLARLMDTDGAEADWAARHLAPAQAGESADPTLALVARARDGDSRAFEALYRAHSGRTYALCLRMTRSEAAAQDCLQETFIRAWRQLPNFEGRSRFSTWLHRIAVNQVLDQQRRERRHEGDEMDDQMLAAPTVPGASPEDLALERAIAGLPDGARNVLILAGLHGYSHEETGEMLGIAVGTSKAQLHRARRLLAERLGPAATGGTAS